MQIKSVHLYIASALFLIFSGFLGGIGEDLWITLKATLTESEVQPSVSFNIDNILSYSLAVAGVVLLSWYFYKHNIVENRGKQSPESKLNDLIKEVKKFIKKWNRGLPLLTVGYRQQILDKSIWNERPEKILRHSIFFKRRIAQVKELKIKNSSSILNSLTDISNEIAKLGNDIENTVLTERLEDEALKKDPKIFENFVATGDKICEDLKTIILELETLRTHVL